MEKDMIFFTQDANYQGVKFTSTSANHIANMAKQQYQAWEEALDSLKFYSETVSLIGSPTQTLISEGNNDSQLEQVPSMINNIAKAKSLIAWLREAIKAREHLVEEINNTTLEVWAKANNIVLPTEPTEDDSLTEDEYLASLGVKERNAYLQLQTQCAVLGKYIHQNGSFATARANMVKASNNPHRVSDSGRDTTIYTKNLSVTPEKVEDMYFELQQAHRELQASLNSLEHKKTLAIEKSEAEVLAKYNEEYDNYTTEMAKHRASLKKWKQAKITEIGNWKIILPDSLKEIYETIAALGKK